MINHERLKELLSYDPDTGDFRWLVTRAGKALRGSIGGKQIHLGSFATREEAHAAYCAAAARHFDEFARSA